MKKKALDAAALLRTANVRATPQRIRIVEILHARHRPVSIEALVKAGKGVFDMTTAYRSVEMLWKSGVVRRIDLKQQHALYELAEDHHHHAVCTSCGALADVSMCITPSLDEKVRRAVGFSRVDSHALEFFGICQNCAKK